MAARRTRTAKTTTRKTASGTETIQRGAAPEHGTLVTREGRPPDLPDARAPKAGSVKTAPAAALSPTEAQRKALFDKIPKARREQITAELNTLPLSPPPTAEAFDQRHALLEEAFVQHEAAKEAEARGDEAGHHRAGALREYEDNILERLATLDRRAERSKANRP